jgi:CYTH domain-containing protein
MSAVLEIELTFLAARLPDLSSCKRREMRDVYFPADTMHPVTRIRQKGDSYEFTKKMVVDPEDAGTQREENVELTKAEYEALAQGNGKEIVKTRYYLPYQGVTVEIDVFAGDLAGLVVIDFEFQTQEAKNAFVQPDFCLVDVTQDEVIAGGMLAGKAYEDIRSHLEAYNYQPLKYVEK